jgi:hypothetical protein
MKFKCILTLSLLLLLSKNIVLASPFSAENLNNEPLSNISPIGELRDIFMIASTYTDLQRKRKLAELKGKVVQWVLPVHEVREEGDNCYEIILSPSLEAIAETMLDSEKRKLLTVGVTAYVEPRTEGELKFIESLRTGDFVKIKGRLTGQANPLSRSLIMFPATFLVSEPSSEGNSK